MRRLTRLAIGLAAAMLLGSCAYYNTFFMAKRYYMQATLGQPYVVDKADPSRAPNFNKSVDYCKKLIGNYPKSKWVDDATLLWARGLIGKDDPAAAVDMLQRFNERYPKSPIRGEATFYLGLSYRLSHKYTESVTWLEESRRVAPRGAMAPYSLLEESRALVSLRRFEQAAAVADTLANRYPRHLLHDRALLARAEARLALGDYQRAREDYRTLGRRAANDDDRFLWLLKEADCLEAGHDNDGSLALLKDAISHEHEPVLSDTTGKPGTFVPANTAGGADRWGQLKLRIGGVYTLMGNLKESLAAFDEVLLHYWRTTLAAEAQYRRGFAYETVGDDFDIARSEYAKVRDQSASSVFAAQALQRMGNLDRLAQFRVAGGDSVAKEAEASFMRAELYLFQNDKPQRALDEYRGVSDRFGGTGWDAKAKLAQAWVRRNRMRDSTGADSLLWVIVNHHPATEAQLAARDYLEDRGESVPDSLIKMPERPLLAIDTTRTLSAPPALDTRLGTVQAIRGDSTLRLGLRGSLYGNNPNYGYAQPDSALRARMALRAGASIDSLAEVVAHTDSLTRASLAARRDSTLTPPRAAALRDSLVRAAAVARPDTSARNAPIGPPIPPDLLAPKPARGDSLP